MERIRSNGTKLVWLTGLLAACLVSGVVYAYHKLSDPSFLPVKFVRIEGTYHKIDKERLKQTIIPFVNHGFFAVNTDEITSKVLAMPWVKTVDVYRSWPDTLVVDLTEQHAVALWNGVGLLNAAGDVFRPNTTTFPQNLPALHGPEGQAFLVLDYYQKMARTLQPLGLAITDLSLSSRRAWQVTLNNGMKISLGRTKVMAHFNRFVSVYERIFRQQVNDVAIVDMTYTNGMAVRWRAHTTQRGEAA